VFVAPSHQSPTAEPAVSAEGNLHLGPAVPNSSDKQFGDGAGMLGTVNIAVDSVIGRVEIERDFLRRLLEGIPKKNCSTNTAESLPNVARSIRFSSRQSV
jgi:hypothetical protein